MKRVLLTLVFSLCFTIAISSLSLAVVPHPCSASGLTNDTILSLYDYTNSHGAIWNDTNGTLVEVCYSEVFGMTYDPAHLNTDVHVCSGSNLVLTLSSIANAHANGPLQTPYPVPICYGDLVCQLKSGACTDSQREIVSLSSPTNAHLERPEMNAFANQYRVCCTSAYAGGSSGPICGNGVIEAGEQCDGSNLSTQTCNDLGFTGGSLSCYPAGGGNQCTFNTAGCTGGSSSVKDVHWEDSAGNKIGRSVNKATYVNRTIRAVATTTAGTIVTFNVSEDDSLTGDTFDDKIRGSVIQADSSGKAIFTFRITDADIAAGDDVWEGTSQEFYFIASAGASNNKSEIVDVDETQGPNTSPIANITAPIHRGVYYNSTTVLFNQSSYDSEGGMTFDWSIAEDNYRDNRSSFLYTFKKPGMKTVTLRVTDDRGAWDEQEVTILVIAAPDVLAYINMPFNRQVVPAQSNGILSLTYAANESFVVSNNVTSAAECNLGVSCLAGTCPNQTQNSPSYCPGPGAPVRINGAPKNFAGTTFNWTVGNDGLRYDGFGDNYVLGGRLFSANQAGPQTINLGLNYKNNAVDLTQNAYRTFTMGQCIDSGHTFIRIDLLTGKEVSRGSTTSSNYCTGQNLAVGGGDDCCPAGFQCGTSGGTTKCYGVNKTSCSDYNVQSECVGANPAGFPEYSQSRCGETVNGSVIDCECSWKSSDNTCFLNVSSRNNNCGTSCNSAPTNYQCNVLSYNEHECVNGYADVDIIREFIAGTGPGAITNPNDATPPCINETITGVLCGRPSFDLDLVSDWTIFISAIFIAGIYIVFYAFRKNDTK